MHLKRIEIFGFKSFAEKTEIELDKGVAAILGPNGCGKSNVVDAIKWVLGEQSSKSLRADKMDDLIFGGTEKRKALSVAEVALTLENNADELGLDLPEICIKRRVFRNGEGEYYINNVPVKLRELKEALLEAGIGKGAYSIMEQGKIDHILSSKPEERRYIFEEAAGISKQRAKWQEADRKLLRTAENIDKVKNVLAEVQRNYNSLKKQADKATAYRSLKDKRFEQDRNIYLLRLRNYSEQKNKKENAIKDSAATREDIKKELDIINESLDIDLDLVNKLEKGLNDSNKQLYGLSIEKKNIESQNASLAERTQEIEERIRQDKSTEKHLGERIIILKGKHKDLDNQGSDIDDRIRKTEENIGSFAESIKNAQTRIRDNKHEEKKQEEGILSYDAQIRSLQSDLQKLTDDIVQELDEKLKMTNTSQREQAEKQLEGSISTFKQQLKRIRQNLADVPSPEEQPEVLLPLFREAMDALEGLYGEIHTNLAAYKSAIPTFIEDFLAPEGIITQKRNIDIKLLELRENIENNRARIATLNKENVELTERVEQYKATLQESLVNMERIKAEKKALQKESDNLRRQISELQSQIQVNQQKIAEDEGRLVGLKKRGSELSKEEKNIQSKEKNLQSEIKKLSKQISDKNKALSGREHKRKKHLEGLAKAQDRHENNRILLSEINTEIRNLYSHFRDQHSRDLSEFENIDISVPLGTAKNKLRGIQEQLRSFGSVNLMAIEDFTEVKERYTFLNDQLQDLYKAQKDLEEVTHQIREESAKMFMQSYEHIKTNFNMLFRKLFGGGRAELRLLNADDSLESGIEIYAQPPGKRLESIALLSGGERSLTAVALIFAAYMLKPAPFCFLDEIDAALDEGNIGRFASMLSEFAQTSQFIIVTHNKKTVTAANTLLGITMEESGVSKLVSIRVAEGKIAEEKVAEKKVQEQSDA